MHKWTSSRHKLSHSHNRISVWYTDRGYIEREKESRTTRTTARKQKPTVFIHALYCHCLFFFVFFSLCFHLFNNNFFFCFVSFNFKIFFWMADSEFVFFFHSSNFQPLLCFFFFPFLEWLLLKCFFNVIEFIDVGFSVARIRMLQSRSLFFASVWIACWTH